MCIREACRDARLSFKDIPFELMKGRTANRMGILVLYRNNDVNSNINFDDDTITPSSMLAALLLCYGYHSAAVLSYSFFMTTQRIIILPLAIDFRFA